jgi:hypothetical protein
VVAGGATLGAMRVMLLIWSVVIITGLVAFSIIGLSRH